MQLEGGFGNFQQTWNESCLVMTCEKKVVIELASLVYKYTFRLIKYILKGILEMTTHSTDRLGNLSSWEQEIDPRQVLHQQDPELFNDIEGDRTRPQEGT